MYDSISLDPNTLRLCQLDAAQWRQSITPNRCQNIAKHRDEYLQIEHDNPNLIWLYTLILQEEVKLSQGEIISAIKQKLLSDSSLTPIAWRYIANGTADDFRVVLDSHNLGEEPQWRWHTMLAWLQVLSGLRLNNPIPEPLQELFLHDGLVVEKVNEEVLFRGAWMGFNTLRHILEEAEKRLAAGNLQQFSETEMVDVITWLAATDPVMDNNQINNGWGYLTRTASEWKSDIAKMKDYQDLKWNSALPQMQIEDWIVDPVIDAWSLHRLAISQRHCGDRYVEDCLNDEGRIFKVDDFKGKTVGTIRLVRKERSWVVGDIRGFANAFVPAKLSSLGEEVARKYTEQEQGF